MSQVHPLARTTPRTRSEINSSTASIAELARRYNISLATARKWKQRDDVEDRSHCPKHLNTTLSAAQEILVVELRRLLLLPLDDLLVITREFICKEVSRSGLDRCLRRHGVANLRDLYPKAEGETEPKKTFKDYEPGFLHMDIKYLPQMPDETQRRYLFVAIDRATRWVYLHIYADQTERSSVDFLRRVKQAAPMKIVKLLTDNGSQFTDRFSSQKKEPSGQHVFDRECSALGIEHRLAPPRHPQTNGMVERFNGRIAELIGQTRFASAAELETTLIRYLTLYNHHIPQRALNHQSPIQALKKWHNDKPELFVKNVYKHAGLDRYAPCASALTWWPLAANSSLRCITRRGFALYGQRKSAGMPRHRTLPKVSPGGGYVAIVALRRWLRGQSFRRFVREYRGNRGMDFFHDIHDWLGGYPYESISPEEVTAVMQLSGFALSRRFVRDWFGAQLGLFGSGCDEYVYRRHDGGALDGCTSCGE